MKLSCEEISRIVSGELLGDNQMISDVVIDSRKIISHNTCFVAIGNGVNYISDAIKKGAKLIISEEQFNGKVSKIYVHSVIKALGDLGKANIGLTKIIAVTGSAGKTTTKEMIISVLREKFKVTGTIANQNNEIGVPLTLLAIKRDEDYCVVEMGMRKKGDIEYLASIVRPEISVITNCGNAHIENFIDADEIFQAKTEIIKYTRGSIIVPNEKRFVDLYKKNHRFKYIGKNGDVEAININEQGSQLFFDVLCNGELIECIELNTIYLHNINNSLFAISIAKELGLSNEQIRAGLKKFRSKDLREEMVAIGKCEIVVDCYNASYESMKSSIESVTKYGKRKNKCVYLFLGDMLELGENSINYHIEIGKMCKKIEVQGVFVHGELAKEIKRGFSKAEIIGTIDEMYERLLEKTSEDCIVLIKASRKMRFERIINEVRERLNVE